MQRYFCFERETLKEAMNTRVKVNGLSDIINLLTSPSYLPNLTNIHIDNDPIEDERCLEYEGWGNITYDVLADLENGHKNQCVGMCNFYEENEQRRNSRVHNQCTI